MKGLKTRAITAVVFVAVMIGGIYGGPNPMRLLLGLICLLCLWEYFNLVFHKTNNKILRKIIGTALGLGIFMVFYQGFSELPIPNRSFMADPFLSGHSLNLGYIVITLTIIIAATPLLFIFELYQKTKSPFENIGKTLLGIFYIAFPLSLLMVALFKNGNYRPNLLMGIFLLIWSNDTFAYLVGSQIGKNKLFPRISPGKTWEGTIGGGICTLIVAFLLSLIFRDIRLVDWMAIGLIAAVFGTIGDLVESMLKRSKNVKDSGNFMPGHGGALDRFDAFIFVLPFIGIYLILLG